MDNITSKGITLTDMTAENVIDVMRTYEFRNTWLEVPEYLSFMNCTEEIEAPDEPQYTEYARNITLKKITQMPKQVQQTIGYTPQKTKTIQKNNK